MIKKTLNVKNVYSDERQSHAGYTNLSCMVISDSKLTTKLHVYQCVSKFQHLTCYFLKKQSSSIHFDVNTFRCCLYGFSNI